MDACYFLIFVQSTHLCTLVGAIYIIVKEATNGIGELWLSIMGSVIPIHPNLPQNARDTHTNRIDYNNIQKYYLGVEVYVE